MAVVSGGFRPGIALIVVRIEKRKKSEASCEEYTYASGAELEHFNKKPRLLFLTDPCSLGAADAGIPCTMRS